MSEAGGILILVRHGLSQWNLEDRFTGWVDVPLTPEGEAEARRAGELLQGYTFNHAFTSVLRRSIDTLDIILDVLGQKHVPVSRDAALNERHYGDLQGLNKAETGKRLGEAQVMYWRRSFRGRPPGGESLEDTANRVLPYYRARIEPLVRAGGTALVVAHLNSLRALIMQLDGISEADVPKLYVPTGVPLRYEIDRTEGKQ